jgi:hypothetical protein
MPLPTLRQERGHQQQEQEADAPGVDAGSEGHGAERAEAKEDTEEDEGEKVHRDGGELSAEGAGVVAE